MFSTNQGSALIKAPILIFPKIKPVLFFVLSQKAPTSGGAV